MAEGDTPFAGGGGGQGDIAGQWATWLDKPANQTFLLQAGLELMQPPSFGDTAASQIGRAIGAGGEATGRQEKMDIVQQEAQSKQEERAARAQAAEARAYAAQSGLSVAQQKADVQKMNIESLIEYRHAQTQARTLREESNRMRAEAAKDTNEIRKGQLLEKARQNDIYAQDVESRAQRRLDASEIARSTLEQRGTQSDVQNRIRYQMEVGRIQRANQGLLPGLGQQNIPIPKYEDWIAAGAPSMTGAPTPPRAGTPTTTAPTGAIGTKDNPVRVRTPEEANSLDPGTVYVTPDGSKITR